MESGFISSRKEDNHLTYARTLFSSESRSSDWEDDFELGNQSTSVAYHLGNIVINLLALCMPFVALLLFCCSPTPFIQCHNCSKLVSIRVKKCSCGQNMRKRSKAFF